MRIRQSDLSAYGRCAQEKKLKDLARDGIGPRPSNLSRTIFGTIMHHAVQIMETEHHQGNPAALEIAKSTFAYYWNPDNMPEMAAHHPELIHGIDEWLPRDTYGGMRSKGLKSLEDYYDLLKTDDGKLLALELTFEVPIDLEEQGQHVLTGTVDRVSVRKFRTKPYLSLDDHKTGKQPAWLRYHVQFTVYAYASLQRPFWDPWGDEGDEMYDRYKDVARRGRWNDLRLNKQVDAGWRSEQDYARLKVALKEYVRAVEADVYPLTMTGETCLYCFAGETGVWTADGMRPIRELAGTSPRLLVNTGSGGTWVQAPVRAFGVAPVLSVTLARGRATKTIRATPDHRWLVRERQDETRTVSRKCTTDQLRRGDRLLSMTLRTRLTKITICPFGIAAGIIYGDGCATVGRTTSNITLWNESRELARYFSGCSSSTVENANGAKGITVEGLPRHFKSRPDLDEAAGYLYGWLAGYFAADGSISAAGQIALHSASREDLEFARTVATRVGIFTHEITGRERLGINGRPGMMYRFVLAADSLREDFFLQERHRSRYRKVQSVRSWTVVDVQDHGEVEEVFCATVPVHENFVIEGFINVMNCPFRAGACGGVPVPAEDSGRPA